MEELISSLQILAKYSKPAYPTHCEHDTLFIMVDPELVSDEDKDKLKEYGVYPSNEGDFFQSYKFGSA